MKGKNNKIFYQERPYIYALAGLAVLYFFRQYKVASVSGWILIGCSILVFYMRYSYRMQQQELTDKNKKYTKDQAENKIKIKL